MEFFLGTTNKYKIRELASILNPLGVKLSVTEPIDPEETGATFEDNARIKAVAYARHVMETNLAQMLSQNPGIFPSEIMSHMLLSQMWTISEDSGIVVPALGGLPGHYAARFADCVIKDGQVIGHEPSNRDRDQIDLANNLLLLEMMKGIEQPHRAAKFVVSLMVADAKGQIIFQTTSEEHGWIADEMRGQDGFGYDPIFISDKSFGSTWAELDSQRKNLISHRRKALQDFTVWLAGKLKGE